MTGTEVVLLLIFILGFAILIIRYITGPPFQKCGRRVYAEEF